MEPDQNLESKQNHKSVEFIINKHEVQIFMKLQCYEVDWWINSLMILCFQNDSGSMATESLTYLLHFIPAAVWFGVYSLHT